MDYNSLEPVVTYENNRFITDEETSDKELFDVSYVIKNILVLGAVTLFVASAKTYKTTLMAILANLIASGAPDFLGNPIQMVRILYLTNEAPKVARKRFRAVKRFLGIEPSIQNITFYDGKSFLITPENVSKLCEELKTMGDLMPRLVIIDPIASMFSGDMSDATAALAFRSCLDQFTGLNMAVLCGHHFNKKITEILD